jgi:excinuclease UvrABC ATPase subunit
MIKQILFKLFLPLIIMVFLITNIKADDPPQFNYIGVEACGRCHKSEKQGKQLSIWQESIHSHAYKTLQSEESASIVKQMGFDKPANELKECLVCHASGWDVDKESLEKGFKIEDGVQCETCHGPGSEYKSLKIMKNRELAVQNGLVKVFENTEEFCQSCHNPDSPTFAGFDFEAMWAKIEHNVPVKKKEK